MIRSSVCLSANVVNRENPLKKKHERTYDVSKRPYTRRNHMLSEILAAV